MLDRFSPKDPVEKLPLVFDFSEAMEPSESIISSSVSISVYRGTDGTPSAVLNGTPLISGDLVIQGVQNGVDGVDYLMKAVATTSNPEKVLSITTILPVRIPT